MAKTKKRKKSVAMVSQRRAAPPVVVRRYVPARRKSGGGGTAGGVSAGKLLLAGAALSFLTRPSSGGASAGILAEPLKRVPGTSTFGAATTLGLICYGADKYLKRNPWLRAAGIIGVGLAGLKVGEQGAAFKFVGDGPPEVGIDMDGDY